MKILKKSPFLIFPLKTKIRFISTFLTLFHSSFDWQKVSSPIHPTTEHWAFQCTIQVGKKLNEAHPGRFHHGFLLVPVETFCDIFYCSMNVQSLLIFTVARPSKLIMLLPSLQVQCMSKVSRRMINSETQLTQSSRPRATSFSYIKVFWRAIEELNYIPTAQTKSVVHFV